MNPEKSVILVLAAGKASRMGRAKQLLEYEGKSLLQRAIVNAKKTNLPVLVVLGAYQDQTVPQVEDHHVPYVINKSWDEGIGSSINIGLRTARARIPGLKGVLITLADQPLITSDHINTLVNSTAGSPNIMATAYHGIIGVPAYFPKKYFRQLETLKGDKGARWLINEKISNVTSIPFSAAAQDIDTEQDWLDFKEGRKKR